MSTIRPLRYLIAAPDGGLAEWQARCIGHLTSVGARAVGRIATVRTTHGSRSLFWSMATALSRPRSLREVRDGIAIPDLPLVKSADALGRDAIDFVIDFDCGAPGGAIDASFFAAAPLGCWRFAFAPSPPGAPPGAGDLAAGREVACAALVACDAQGVVKRVLKRGALAITRTRPGRHVDELLYEVARWPAHACDMLQGSGASSAAGEIVIDEKSLFDETEQTQGPQGAIGFLVRTLIAGAAALLRRFFFSSSWNIGVAKAPIESFAKDGPLPEIAWYPKTDVPRFAADPFGLIVDGHRIVLCESLFPGSDGTIHSASYDGTTWGVDLELSLELGFHLSYPYIIEHEGGVYCVPEASASGEISIYRAVTFPDRWEKHATLVSGVGGVDNTIVRFGDRWWMFAGDIADGPDFKLRIWYADDLFGPWHPHAANPVKIDVRSSRGAGTPFVVDGVLYRPSQDCSQTYGGRVIVNRVLKLTPTEFVEESARIVDPESGGPYRFGLHTLSRFGENTLVDGKQRFWSASRWVRLVKRSLRK
ncbi:MAG TPA: hypothetical protein VID24_11035 [Candidatus Eremiobacteraceae bacterium]